MTTHLPPVRRSVTVNAPPEKAFEVFTVGHDAWMPKEYAIGPGETVEIVFEPGVGGRLFQRKADGTECVEGVVKVWEPPTRVVLSWAITPDWQPEPDPEKCSEYEVTFTDVGDGRTRVDVEHRDFHKHGPGGAHVRAAVDDPNGWAFTLGLLAEVAGGT